MKKAYGQYKKTESSAGRRDPMLERKWSRLCRVFERVGRALEEDYESDSDQELVVETQTDGKKQKKRDNNDCFEYCCLGECPYGDGCKWNHTGGAAGSNRSEIADTDGNCLQFLEYGNCRRLEKRRCPLEHDASVLDSRSKDDRPAPGGLTSKQHTTIIRYAKGNRKDPSKVSWEEVKADGGLDKRYEKVVIQRDRNVFPVLRPSAMFSRGRRSDMMSYSGVAAMAANEE